MDSMQMKSLSNRFLFVNDDVVLTPLIDEVIAMMDPFFGEAGMMARVSSGLRTEEKQLSIIVERAIAEGLDKEFPEIRNATPENETSWLTPWGKLLTLGFMVNPPKPARAPFDYMRNGQARKAGILIGISDHQKGGAFDIAEGDMKLDDIATVVIKARASGSVPQLVDYLPEPVNHAIHCDCIETKLNKF